MLRYFKENQPIALTGILRHVGWWITSGTSDVTYNNPAFNVTHKTNTSLDDGIAIYCIHGTADRNASFQVFAERLIASIPPTMSSITLVSFDHRAQGKKIEEFAEQLKEKIKANKHKNVIVIGHSRGGLVASRFDRYLADENDINAHGVLPICSPFFGSPLAIWPLSWFSDSVKQMEINSESLKPLREEIIPVQHKYYYFSAAKDSIAPYESTVIKEGCQFEKTLERHGHLSIMSSHKLVAHVRDCLFEIHHRLYPQQQSVNTETIADEFKMEIASPYSKLEEACIEIDMEIARLSRQFHLKSSQTKITVLAQLMEMLMAMLNGNRGDNYPEAVTIGDFISAWLQDETAHKNGNPISILSENLNPAISYVAGLFKDNTPGSLQFINVLKQTYQSVSLPANASQVMLVSNNQF